MVDATQSKVTFAPSNSQDINFEAEKSDQEDANPSDDELCEEFVPKNMITIKVLPGKKKKRFITYITNIDPEFDLEMIARYFRLKHGTNCMAQKSQICISGEKVKQGRELFLKLGYLKSQMTISGAYIES